MEEDVKKEIEAGGLMWLLGHSLPAIWTPHPHIHRPHLSSEDRPRHQDEDEVQLSATCWSAL